MARKWRLFSGRVQLQSVLRGEGRGKKEGRRVLVGRRRLRRFLVLLLSALLGLAFSVSSVWSNGLQAQTGEALELARLGQQSYRSGQFGEAARVWQQAAEAYRQAGDRQGMTKSLINRSQALQDLGLDAKACDTLLQAFSVETLSCTPTQIDTLLAQLDGANLTLTEAIGLRSLGNVLRRKGLLERSQTVLQLSLPVVEGTPEASATRLSLGNTERALGNQTRNRLDYERITEIIDNQTLQAVLEPYQEAFSLYQQTVALPSSPETKMQAQLNQLSLLLELKDWWSEQTNRRVASWTRLNQPKLSQRSEAFLSTLEASLNQEIQAVQRQIEASLPQLPLSHTALTIRINYAQCLMKLEQNNQARAMLETARKQARLFADPRAESYAFGYLGKLAQPDLEQAVELTRQALLLAQEQSLSGDAREIAYLWQSQLGSLLREQGDTQGAIASYSSAYNTLQSLRTDLNLNNQDVQFNFREQVRPVYLELADLLLTTDLNVGELSLLEAAAGTSSGESSADLAVPVEEEARTRNSFPSSERRQLANPKGGTSSFVKEVAADGTNAEDRLTLTQQVIESLQLAELDNFFQDPCVEEAAVAVQIEDLDAEAAVFYPIVLENRLEVLLSLPGQPLQAAATSVSEVAVNETLDALYDTLDNPSANDSARNIFLTANPEAGELEANLQKLLPLLTQVYDWLIRPFETQLDASSIKTLVFVLNGRLQKVPMAALYDGRQYLIEKYGVSLVPSLQLVAPREVERQPLRVLAAGVSESVEVRGETFPALINVPEELAQIETAFPRSQQLLNEEFTVASLQNQLQGNFPVVHLATHAQFSSDPQQNFIVTGQGNSITIEQLSELLKDGDSRFPELLVLSACQTATGDEQAILGLAGVAVRSGSRSTLATLWPVEDASTAELMGQFYQNFKEPGASKTNALRSAQLSLIAGLNGTATKELQALPPHPYYWAPYVLVGNWQ